MVSITSEYGLYLYTGKVDMRKGIDGLCGIVSDDVGKICWSDFVMLTECAASTSTS